MNRRKSREVAMNLGFEMLINREEYEDVLETFKENTDFKFQDVDFEYVEKLVNGIYEHDEELDAKIEENLRDWKLNRLSKVDLTILRIATYEMLFDEEIPNTVAINEAIELAKKYSDEKSASFINAVLDNMIK